MIGDDRVKNIINYEIKKFFNKRKNILLVLSLIIYILIMNVSNYQNYKKYNIDMHKKYWEISQNAANRRGFIEQVLNIKNIDNFNEEEVLKYKKEYEFLKGELENSNNISNAYKNIEESQWANLLPTFIYRRNLNIINSYENGLIDEQYLLERKIDIGEIEYNLYKYNYFLENHIEFQVNEYEPNGANMLLLFFKGYNILIIVSIITLLSMDVFLSAVEEGSYKLEYTQPFKRKNIYWAKLISMFIIIFIMISLILLFNFAINSLIFGIGDFNYPEVVSGNLFKLSSIDSEGNFMIISLREKILLGINMTILLVLFSISLITALSIFTDSMSKTLGVSTIIIISTITFKLTVSKSSIINLIHPYMYTFLDNVVSGFYRSNYLFGIIINVILSTVLIILSYFKFIKKDFLGAAD